MGGTGMARLAIYGNYSSINGGVYRHDQANLLRNVENREKANLCPYMVINHHLLRNVENR